MVLKVNDQAVEYRKGDTAYVQFPFGKPAGLAGRVGSLLEGLNVDVKGNGWGIGAKLGADGHVHINPLGGSSIELYVPKEVDGDVEMLENSEDRVLFRYGDHTYSITGFDVPVEPLDSSVKKPVGEGLAGYQSLFFVLGEKPRFRMVYHLARTDELNATELQRVSGNNSQAAASKNISILLDAGFIRKRKQGKYNYFSLDRGAFSEVGMRFLEDITRTS